MTYLSKKHVWEKDEAGVLRLRYAPGDLIPEAEARKQGLVKTKAVKTAEDKGRKARGKGAPAV
jgi:hypothetical protein